MHKAILPLAALALIGASAAHASETVIYSYDAKGRLVKVERTGAVNNGVVTEYRYDKADNRTNVKTTGSTN
jgi:YD repeat-containing protein